MLYSCHTLIITTTISSPPLPRVFLKYLVQICERHKKRIKYGGYSRNSLIVIRFHFVGIPLRVSPIRKVRFISVQGRRRSRERALGDGERVRLPAGDRSPTSNGTPRRWGTGGRSRRRRRRRRHCAQCRINNAAAVRMPREILYDDYERGVVRRSRPPLQYFITRH